MRGLGERTLKLTSGSSPKRCLRNVRFLSAIGLHTGHMSVAQSEKMFRESAFADIGNARQQAARGTFDPAYLNYTLGKLMIRKLRDDWTASRGGRSAWREFHDQFLRFGGPPIPLVRCRDARRGRGTAALIRRATGNIEVRPRPCPNPRRFPPPSFFTSRKF